MTHGRQTLVGAICLVLLLQSSGRAQDAEEFDPRAAIRIVAGALSRAHLRPAPLDDALSRRWVRAFLDRLDPTRMYLLDEDFREFRRFENRLDDLALTGDFAFPELVRARCRKRVAEAAGFAAEFLEAAHDDTVDEELPLTFGEYAKDHAALRERWRLRLKGELLIERVHGAPLAEVRQQLAGRYQRILRQIRDMSDERLCQIYLGSLAALHDPHSAYLSPSHLADWRETVTVAKFDLGLELRPQSGRFVIAAVHPSRTSSLRPRGLIGWHVLAIRRLDGAVADLVELHPDDLHSLIHSPSRGLESETEVVLELIHPETLRRASVSWLRLASS